MEEQNSSKHKNFDLGLNRIIMFLVHWATKAETVSTSAFSIMGVPEEVDLYLCLGSMHGKRGYLSVGKLQVLVLRTEQKIWAFLGLYVHP